MIGFISCLRIRSFVTVIEAPYRRIVQPLFWKADVLVMFGTILSLENSLHKEGLKSYGESYVLFLPREVIFFDILDEYWRGFSELGHLFIALEEDTWLHRGPKKQGELSVHGFFVSFISLHQVVPTCKRREEEGIPIRTMIMWQEKCTIYDELVSLCPRIERKGKTMPYTSANGYMFSLLNKAGEIGIRFSKEVQQKYLKEFDSTVFKSHNSIVRGYVLIPDEMLTDLDAVATYLNESYDYVMSLEPK